MKLVSELVIISSIRILYMLNIERIHNPSKQEFIEEFFKTQKPCIISGSIDNWSALELWNIEYLRTKIGHKLVRCRISDNSYFDNYQRHEPVKLANFFDWIVSEQNSEFFQIFRGKISTKQYFVGSLDISSYFPELLWDLQLPNYFESNLLMSNNLWIGNGNNRVNLHYDFYHNLNAQIIGEKHWIVYPPQQSSLLYPHSRYSKYFWCSQVNIQCPDYAQFPKFKDAKSWEGTVIPGEMIFIPAGWWHSPIGRGFNIAVNFWWRIKLEEIANILFKKFDFFKKNLNIS